MADMYTFILSKLQPLISINNCATICDYGCGKGEFLSILKKENPDLSLTGIDFFSKFGKDNTLDCNKTEIKFIDRETEEFTKLQIIPKFDLLISTFALHHFQYPVKELQLITKLIKSGGLLVLIDFSFRNDSKANISKNISSFIEEMRMAIKRKYHRHHYTLTEAKDLFKAIPVEIINSIDIQNELTDKENEENLESAINRNSILQRNLMDKAPEYWKDMWIPFFEQEKFLLENYGIDYSSLFFIVARVK